MYSTNFLHEKNGLTTLFHAVRPFILCVLNGIVLAVIVMEHVGVLMVGGVNGLFYNVLVLVVALCSAKRLSHRLLTGALEAYAQRRVVTL